MKKVDKDFELFQKCFKQYQRQFGLTGYRVYFKYEPVDAFASITVIQNTMVATVRLNSKLPAKDKPFKDIKQSAKHEAIHLLLARFQNIAENRYVTEGELCEASEEIIFKLERLIP